MLVNNKKYRADAGPARSFTLTTSNSIKPAPRECDSVTYKIFRKIWNFTKKCTDIDEPNKLSKFRLELD